MERVLQNFTYCMNGSRSVPLFQFFPCLELFGYRSQKTLRKFPARGKFPGEEQNGEPLTLLLALPWLTFLCLEPFLPKKPELKFPARGKFQGEEQNGEPLTLLLADDCTEVDDEEYFQTLGEKTWYEYFYWQEHFYFIVDNPVLMFWVYIHVLRSV